MSPKLKVALRLALLQARWEPERMQGAGFAYALEPWLAATWTRPEDLRAARERHLDYFNTHPAAAWLIAGIVCRAENAAAAATGEERARIVAGIVSRKKAFGASLAGLYDSFFWGALRPASAVAGLLAAQLSFRAGFAHPLALGVAVALAVYDVPAVAARWVGFSRGLAQGEAAALALSTAPCQPTVAWTRRAAAAGAALCALVGAWDLPRSEKALVAAILVAAAALSRRGVAPLAQLGLAGAVGAVLALAGVTP